MRLKNTEKWFVCMFTCFQVITGHAPGTSLVLEVVVVSTFLLNVDKRGLWDGDTEAWVQPLAGLDVCVYYTLEKIKQNQSEFVSRTLLKYLCCFVLLLMLPKEQVSVPWKSGLNPVHLCPYEAKEFLPSLILLMVFSPAK